MRKRIGIVGLLVLVLTAFTVVQFKTKFSKADTNSSEFARGQIIVQLKKDSSIDSVFLNTYGLKNPRKVLRQFKFSGKVKQNIESLGLDRWYVVETAVPNLNELLALVKKDKNVESAELNYAVKAMTTPNDPRFSDQWSLTKIKASDAWDISHDSSFVVGVIDTGVDYNHEDLKANVWTNEQEKNGTKGFDDDSNGFIDDIYGWDFANNDSVPLDDHGHGTHVAGTIGAVGNNNVGITGVNWNIKIAALKFLEYTGYGYNENATRAIVYSTLMGFKITNNSWGGGNISPLVLSAIKLADMSGNLFIAAAGNNGVNTDNQDFYPMSYDLPNIVSVGATDRDDTLAGFSNFGAKSVDLAGPGVSILSTVPTEYECTLSPDDICAKFLRLDWCTKCDESGYRQLDGTSMASPHVAGAAALFWALHPSASHLFVKEKILTSVDPLGSLTGKTVSGGRLNLLNLINS